MNGKNPHTQAGFDDDEIPDLSTPEWQARFDAATVRRGRLVVVIWTPRGAATRVISMRKANEREKAAYDARI